MTYPNYMLIKLIFVLTLLVTVLVTALPAVANSASGMHDKFSLTQEVKQYRSVLQPAYGSLPVNKFAQIRQDRPQSSHAQNSHKSYRSKREVVDWVRRNHNADVLKIKLNPDTESYQVKILTARGKVRFLTVSAKR